jgi:Gpi18-like mannosyltransferase
VQFFKSLSRPIPTDFALSLILAIILRLVSVPNRSGDYKTYLSTWYDFITQHDGFNALQYNFANYTVPYLYWLVIAATIFSPLPKIMAIKLFAMIMDFICAFFVYKIVQLKYPHTKMPKLAFIAVILSPTVIYNSSLWGQCDVIYTTGLLACLYFLLTHKQIPALISFAVALSFKFQAMFFAPFLLIMLLKQKIRWYYLPLIPLVYVILILPAWIAGRPLIELLLIYFNQTNQYKELAKGAANFYQYIPNNFYDIVVPMGLLLTVTAILIFVYIIYKNKLEITSDRLIYLATISVLFMPYLLPKMHERYFYPADILSILFAFYFPRYRWVAIIIS